MDAATVERVRQAFAEVTEQEIFPFRFYATLWSQQPTSRAFFKTDMKIQRDRLVNALEWTMTNLDNPKVLVPRLKQLGRHHATRYGIQPFHYEWVGKALLTTFQELLEPEGLWSAGVERDLREAYTVAAGFMIQGADEGYGDGITLDGGEVTFRHSGFLRHGYDMNEVDEYVSVLRGMLRQATTDYADALRQLAEADALIAQQHKYIKRSDLESTTPDPIDGASVERLIELQREIERGKR